MEDFNEKLKKRDAQIRDYLLDRADENTTREIDEKIFVEPDFFEYVSQIELEIIEDLVAGRLSGDDRIRAFLIYDLPINREKLRFEDALQKTVREMRFRAPETVLAPTKLLPAAAGPPIKRRILLDLHYLVPAFGLIVVGLMLVWSFLPSKRDAIEKEIAALNRENNLPVEKSIQKVTIEADAVRSAVTGSSMPKVGVSSHDEIIVFRLGLISVLPETYDATFIDERGSEMFSVFSLRMQSDADGKYISVLVPSRFLETGDFQINVRSRSNDGKFTKAGNFAFRVNRY